MSKGSQRIFNAELELRTQTRAMHLPVGTYLFSVKAATPEPVQWPGGLLFPALHLAPGPGCPHNAVEFIGTPQSSGIWLYKPGDHVVVRISEPNAALIVSSIRSQGTQALDIKVKRVESNAAPAGGRPGALPDSFASAKESVPLQIKLHLRNFGDTAFSGAHWAGHVAERAWVEALAVQVLEKLSSADVEYKTLSANGFETPWMSEAALCGTTGKGLPLVGFAARMKPPAAAAYDCEYSGHFTSGATVGPLRNGVPCRSRTAMDPLLAIQLRIVPREAAAAPEKREPAKAAGGGRGPRFSKFRERAAATPKTPKRK